VAELDYRHLFENGGVAQAIARLDGQFIACNTLFAELCGYAAAA
jgi:PAS domain S-box-containing protein